MTPAEGTLLAAAALGAGMVNSMAGGGTLLTFPALLSVGVPSIHANATSTVALWPGAMGSVAGYREELKGARPFLLRMGVPSVLGGATGAYLLGAAGERTFNALVPWLILFATVLFAFSGPLSRRFRKGAEAGGNPERAGKRALAFQFLVALYGGFFGAGIGILMLASLSLLGLKNIHRMNGIKIFMGMLINSVAVGYFAWRGYVHWPEAGIMAAAAVTGGYLGARIAPRIPAAWVRTLVVIVGLVVSAKLFLRG